jgi:hypothetical protein
MLQQPVTTTIVLELVTVRLEPFPLSFPFAAESQAARRIESEERLEVDNDQHAGACRDPAIRPRTGGQGLSGSGQGHSGWRRRLHSRIVEP